MLRRTLTILSLIGLLLSVGLWGVSYFLNVVRFSPGFCIFWLDKGCIGRSLVLTLDLGNYTLATSPGGVRTMEADDLRVRISASEWIDLPSWTEFPIMDAHTFRWEYAGFKGLATRWTPSVGLKPFRFILPLWMIAVPFSAMTWWLHFLPRLRRRKRKKLGLCLKCGYDLRGSKHICPECGTGFSD